MCNTKSETLTILYTSDVLKQVLQNLVIPTSIN